MIKGFFDIKQDPKPSKKDNSQKTKDCEGCGLYASVHSPKIPYSGEGKKGIFELSEAPGSDEDEQGTQYVGKAGQKFRDTLSRFGLDLDRDFWKDNCLGCRPTDGNKNREPKMFEMKCCASRWQNALRETQPKVVWLMGQKPLEAYFMDRLDIDPDDREGKSGINIGSWRRHAIPDYKNNCWVIPMYHPSFILRNENEKYGIAQTVFERDIRWAMTYVNKELPTKPEAKTICLYKKDEIVSLLKQVLEDKRHLVFDYETTGLKPYTNGHRIISASFRGIQDESAYSFPLAYALHFNPFEYEEIKKVWVQILEDGDILKVAHNMKFEEKWSYNILNTRINGWYWDTMQAEHLLDSRPGITGLKICSFLRWGVDNWGTEIEPYMKAKDGMEFNTIDKCPLDKLLKYGGDDSYWETELYLTQRKQFKAMPSLQKCYDELFHPGALVLEESEDIGVCVDIPYYETTKKTIVDDIALIQTELDESEEAKKFREVTGKDLLWSSNKDLNTLFFDILKVQPLRETKNGYAVDEKSLASFNVPISEKMVAQRKLKKIGTTYINSYIKNAVEGLIHADITLHIAASGRSSCTNPNLQNVIKRNPESMYMIRKGVVPRPGCRIMAADYSQAEVRVMACYTHDPVLINYILTSPGGIHVDQAMEIFMLPKDEISGPLKHIGKNSFVFPQWYGDWWRSCAESIWEETNGKETSSGLNIIKHLRSKGIKELGILDKKGNPSKGSMYEHVKYLEQKFWDLFSVTREWRSKAVRDYLQKGYSDSFTGYRRSGALDVKQIGNTPVQGCLRRGSMVATSEGLIPIENLVNKHVLVWTGFKWADAVGINRGKCTLVEIVLSSGLTINCDTRHVLKGLYDEWIDFKNLKIGDYVALPKLGNDELKNYVIDWFFVLGMIIGDGCTTIRYDDNGNERKCVDIHGAMVKKQMMLDVKRFLDSEGFNLHWYENIQDKEERQTKYVLSTSRRAFANKLESFGYKWGTAHTKRIPNSVWGATKQEQYNFLWGLWLTDGSRGKWSGKSLHMCNKELLNEVQILASYLDIDSYFVQSNYGYLLRFRKMDGKISNRIYPFIAFSDKIRNSKCKSMYRNCISIANDRVLRCKSDARQHVAERIINEFDSIQPIYRYDSIVSIKVLDVEDETFTMSVNDEKHQFVADGVIHKNTAFHCLLWSYTRIAEIIKEEGLKSKMLFEVHDEALIDVPEDEVDYMAKVVKQVMCEDIKEWAKEWLIVPMSCEIKVSELRENGGSWAEMTSYEEVN